MPHIPLRLKKVINKALKSNPDDRYETILDMMNDISKVEENLDIRLFIDTNDDLVWQKDTSKTHYDEIKLTKTQDRLIIFAKKVNNVTKIEKNISKLNKKGYKDNKEAFKVIAEHIKE